MKKVLLILLFGIFIFTNAYSQRILVDENFENTGFQSDSLPPNWSKYDLDPWGGPGRDWAVRDSGTGYVGTSVNVFALAHSGHRALTIPWSAGGSSGIADDWVITDSLNIQTGDSLIFWLMFGSRPPLQPYSDSLQIWALYAPVPVATLEKIATLFSFDSNNVWTEFKFDLSIYTGQTIYIAWRYNMDVSINGLWSNVDDVFIGNRSAIGIYQINTNIPDKFALHQNYPNPFNPLTKIRFDLAKNSNVKITVYNNLGQEVKVLVNEYRTAGYYETDFNASYLPSGVYFYRLETQYYTETKKMVVIK
ncbi:MAG: T9SS type A sorting domain-containing protein [Ignavibacteria bacterium]|nr:T9SS type A sorting domain-containing protein [Ignavibacteria bacterium]